MSWGNILRVDGLLALSSDAGPEGCPQLITKECEEFLDLQPVIWEFFRNVSKLPALSSKSRSLLSSSLTAFSFLAPIFLLFPSLVVLYRLYHLSGLGGRILHR